MGQVPAITSVTLPECPLTFPEDSYRIVCECLHEWTCLNTPPPEIAYEREAFCIRWLQEGVVCSFNSTHMSIYINKSSYKVPLESEEEVLCGFRMACYAVKLAQHKSW